MIMQPSVRCEEFVADVTNWMEGALDADQRSLIEEHLSICPDCVRYVDQLRAALTVLRAASEPAPGPLRDALLAALRESRG
jgi:anti-sigma factor RsiW